jgi:hypothetical protein
VVYGQALEGELLGQRLDEQVGLHKFADRARHPLDRTVQRCGHGGQGESGTRMPGRGVGYLGGLGGEVAIAHVQDSSDRVLAHAEGQRGGACGQFACQS